MKRNKLFFSLSMTLVASMVMQTPIQAAKAPKLSKKSISLCIGDSAKLQMKNAKKSATWKSKNKKIVSVNKKGKIKAKKSGSTKVIAKVEKKNYKCKVTVKKQKLNQTSMNLLVGENKKLKASGVSKRADINWVSTNNEVATVYNGEVVAVGEGKATIKAVIPEVFGKTLKCKVTVKENENDTPDTNDSVENTNPGNNTQKPIDNTNSGNKPEQNEENKNNSSSTIPPHISISGGNGSSNNGSGSGSGGTTVVTNTNTISIVEKEIIEYGSTRYYDISMSGSTDIGKVTWSSSDEKILKVDQNGKAYGLCPGTATIKAATTKGLAAAINVEVVKIEGSQYIDIQEKFDIKESLDYVDVKSLQWKSENSAIASVNKDGIITALKEGTTKITGMIGNVVCVEIKCKVYDNSYISINNPGTLTVGSTETLSTSSSGIPSDAKITWESSNPEILTVSDKGELKALSVGEATISVLLNGKIMDSVTISVEEKEPEEIYFYIDNPEKLMVGDVKTLTASSSNVPNNATIRWESSNTDVLTISDSGEVKALFPGETTITVYVNDRYMDSVTINVEGDVEAELIYNSQGTVVIGCLNKEKATKITIPDGVTTIGVGAFRGMGNLKTATMPDSVVEIDNQAFFSCYYLKDITLSKNIKRLGESAFYSCLEIESIELPETLEEMGNYCFHDCDNLTSITIPNKVKNIPNDCFNSCNNLENVVLPKSVTDIGMHAFSDCIKLKNINIENITRIDYHAFSDCISLEKIIIPDSITSKYSVDEYGYEQIESNIGDGAFSGCSNLKEATLSKNMQYIPEGLFKDCSSLKEVVLPASTIAVGRSAFQSCASLEKVTIPATVTKIDDTVFQYCYSLSIVYGKSDSYAETWAKGKGYKFEIIE